MANIVRGEITKVFYVDTGVGNVFHIFSQMGAAKNIDRAGVKVGPRLSDLQSPGRARTSEGLNGGNKRQDKRGNDRYRSAHLPRVAGTLPLNGIPRGEQRRSIARKGRCFGGSLDSCMGSGNRRLL